MKISKASIQEFNQQNQHNHQEKFDFLAHQLDRQGINVEDLLSKIRQLQIAIPSWALGTGGTRFGRYPGGGEPRNLEEKMEDVGLLHALNQSSGSISLHIPWDIPENASHIMSLATELNLNFDAVNSNTFQDQKGQSYSYKFGSLSHTDPAVRKLAIEHNQEVIDYGVQLGSKAITVWLADGSSFPGQQNFRKSLGRTHDALAEIYQHLPEDWKMLIEYKPFEPYFYSTVIPDWGTSFLLASQLGQKAYTLVDLGHHLPNTNIEQIVATLMMQAKLGGFHFNDSKFADDDLTVGAIKPFQLFLIFNELVEGMEDPNSKNPSLSWMIDASHNLKDPLEDLLQSVEAIKLAYAQALIIDRKHLFALQEQNDVVKAQELVQSAFRTDVRPLVAEAMRGSGGALHPVELFRSLKIREQLIAERGKEVLATGL
ncbi:MAG: sugar isomerase [Candidatus Cyclobacteriaceae bacterium M3_2C_046]